jgi:phosphoadenosine phosphosulfate reductase
MSIAMARGLNLADLNKRFQKVQPEEIIRWAVKEFGARIAMTSSFQSESVVLLHVVSKIEASLPILFLETGWHFPETVEFKNQIVKQFGLKNVIDLKADPKKREASVRDSNNKPYEKDPDNCCYINKVEPLEKALKNYDAWISGIRRSQSKSREDIGIVEEFQNDLFKINPFANVTSGDIWWYIKEHKLPRHPLWEKGYLSIGCWPCTQPAQPGDDERSGRWAGTDKTECGIHTFLKPKLEKQKKKETPESKEEGSGI